MKLKVLKVIKRWDLIGSKNNQQVHVQIPGFLC